MDRAPITDSLYLSVGGTPPPRADVVEQLTFRDGQIVESRLVFDRLSFGPPER